MTYLLVFDVADDVWSCSVEFWRLHKRWQFATAKHNRLNWLLPLLWLLLFPLFVQSDLLLALLKLHWRGKDVAFDTFPRLWNWFRAFFEQMNHLAAAL